MLCRKKKYEVKPVSWADKWEAVSVLINGKLHYEVQFDRVLVIYRGRSLNKALKLRDKERAKEDAYANQVVTVLP